MRAPILPAEIGAAKHFLEVLLSDMLHKHPEYMQAPGNVRLERLADILIRLGWPVRYMDFPVAGYDPAIPVVRAYYIKEDRLGLMIGKEFL